MSGYHCEACEMIAHGERFVGTTFSDGAMNSADRLEALEILAALRELRTLRAAAPRKDGGK